MELILASGSPRRRELVEKMGIRYTLFRPCVDERTSEPPEEAVGIIARRKALAAKEAFNAGIALAADTLVALQGAALGKPVDPDDARRMLGLLSGRTHSVLTGVCLIDCANGRMLEHTEETRVTFRTLTEEEIDRYVRSGEPMDKAGAYGIQGGAGAFVERIEGSYENVMGLPVEALGAMLRTFAEE